MTKSITLSDVAHKSGVSISTASLALRNKPGIPQETRQRVLQAAQELDYRPKWSVERAQPAAMEMHNLGLIIKSDATTLPQANPFYSHVMAGIEEACRQRSINLLYATLPVDEHNRPLEMPRLLLEKSADGLLLVGILLNNETEEVLEANAIPVALVDAYAASNKYDMIVSNNVSGAHQVTSYLIQHGHQHIGLIGAGPDSYPSLRERREGYLLALQEHGVTESYFADCPIEDIAALEAVKALLRQRPQITALVGANDEMALVALQAAQTLGRHVPRDLSIVGFDDIDLAQHVTPPLTTMRVDKAGMGRLAVQLLVDRVQYPDAEQVTLSFHPRLIERQSVAPAPRPPDTTEPHLDSRE